MYTDPICSETALQWDEEAQALLKKVPAFVRPMARKKIEKAAVEMGVETITVELMNQVKEKQMA